MKKILLRGTLSILPFALSIWIFWSIISTMDDLGISILTLGGWSDPFRGAGFALIFLIILIAGLAFSVSPIAWLYQKTENQLLRFPIFKTVYGAVKDLASLVSSDDDQLGHRQTVLLKQANGTYIVGFVTTEHIPSRLKKALPEEDGEWVPVLFQLSYQMAGVTSLARKKDLIYVDWTFEEAMRFMLTAGISQTGNRP